MASGTANRKTYPIKWYRLDGVDDMLAVIKDLLGQNLGWGGSISADRPVGAAPTVVLTLRGPAPGNQREVRTFGQIVVWNIPNKTLSVEDSQAAFDAKYTVVP